MNDYELIDMLKVRTPMYIGDYTISRFQAFLCGYWHARGEYTDGQYENAKQLLPLDCRFMHEFARRYFGEDSSTAGWCNIILRHCNNDEKAALDKFFELFEIYRQIRIVSCRRIVLTDENRQYHETKSRAYRSFFENGNEVRSPLYPDAQVFYDVTLSHGMEHIYLVEFHGYTDVDRCTWSKTYVEEYAARMFGENLHWEDYPCENLPLKPPLPHMFIREHAVQKGSDVK